MKLSQFKFKFPEELIATEPTPVRDEARMMVVHKSTGEIEHRIFKEIINYFDDGDVMVFNDTKVFPAKLIGNKEKTGAKIEVFLLRELNEEHKLWDVLVEPARKIRIGNKLYFGDDESMVAEVIDNTTSRGRTLRFLYDGSHEEFKKALYALGHTPLPEYIKRESTPEDADNYQCIFADKEGAVVAPAAGLHFSRELLKRLEIKGVEQAFFVDHGNDLLLIEDICRLDQQVHIPSLRFYSGQCYGEQFPSSVLHHAHDGMRFRGLRPGDVCLRRGHQREIPLRSIRRCHAHCRLTVVTLIDT